MKQVKSLFDDIDLDIKKTYKRFKIKNNYDMIRFLRQFIQLEETEVTPYKHKAAYYRKKSHYINGKKVNEQVYKFVKTWLESI